MYIVATLATQINLISYDIKQIIHFCFQTHFFLAIKLYLIYSNQVYFHIHKTFPFKPFGEGIKISVNATVMNGPFPQKTVINHSFALQTVIEDYCLYMNCDEKIPRTKYYGPYVIRNTNCVHKEKCLLQIDRK